MLFLIPIVAAAYLTRDQSGTYDSAGGDRKIDCYQIWDQIAHGPGPASIDQGQQAATRLKASYNDRLTTIDKLSRDMDAAWTGKGAAAAQDAGAHPLKAWMQDSGTKLADSDKYLGDQHTAFTTVAAKVQEVPQKPPDNGFLNSVTPWETDTDRAIKDYNTKGQANVDAFNEYFKASAANGKGLPTYSALDGSVDKVGVTDDGKDGKGGDGKAENGTGDGGDGTGTGTGNGGYQPGNIPGGGSGGYTPPNIPGGGGGGYQPGNIPGGSGGYQPGNIPGGGGYQPGNTSGSGGYQPGNIPGSPNYTPPNFSDGTAAAGYTPPNIPGADFSGGGFGPGGSGSAGLGGFGPGGAGSIGSGDFGPGGSGSIGAGGFGPGGSGFGPGSSTGGAAGSGMSGAGSGAGGAGAGGAGGAGAGKPGASGMSGMGGMHGGKGGKGGGDEERTSKYLMGDDPNDLFGTDELTAPPVIGE
jgi:hypothetical protein